MQEIEYMERNKPDGAIGDRAIGDGEIWQISRWIWKNAKNR